MLGLEKRLFSSVSQIPKLGGSGALCPTKYGAPPRKPHTFFHHEENPGKIDARFSSSCSLFFIAIASRIACKMVLASLSAGTDKGA